MAGACNPSAVDIKTGGCQGGVSLASHPSQIREHPVHSETLFQKIYGRELLRKDI